MKKDNIWVVLPKAIVEDFDGVVYNRALDHARLTGQLLWVYDIMADGRWRTLQEICGATTHYDSSASVSARLRDLRKGKFGAYTIERRRRGEAARGIFEYRLTPSPR